MSSILIRRPSSRVLRPAPPFLHLGNARTAFQLSMARKARPVYLRIEDTDAERSRLRFRDELMAELRWLAWTGGGPISAVRRLPTRRRSAANSINLVRATGDERSGVPVLLHAEELELSRNSNACPQAAALRGTCRQSDVGAARRARGEGLEPRCDLPCRTIRSSSSPTRCTGRSDTRRAISALHHSARRRHSAFFFATPSMIRYGSHAGVARR